MSSSFVIVVPQDACPFTVDRQQLVRLAQDGVAGSKIEAEVDGPAELVAQNSLMAVKDGHHILGNENVEFVLRPTGQGTVQVTITTTFLQNEPVVTNYRFDVK